MSTTRRAALLALVVCALILSIVVPLRTYLAQREQMTVEAQRQQDLREQVRQLEDRKAQLSDPAQVEAEARRRLHYVKPGETPYVVQLPGDSGLQSTPAPAQRQAPPKTWYEELWQTISGAGS